MGVAGHVDEGFLKIGQIEIASCADELFPADEKVHFERGGEPRLEQAGEIDRGVEIEATVFRDDLVVAVAAQDALGILCFEV